ncbi:unnamed protein product [Caenorhabditis angaria]|uniref:CUB-like domain-containing protein n=1 Tax=Caenorhabditis angaria TaxID=860376 RepID=A0A9P1IMY4_9PELO|nr:unnamed protein product [Caenorhabditis angaria]
MQIFLAVIFLFAFALADPQILYLKTFPLGSTTNITTENGSNLYLASRDLLTDLQNITLTIDGQNYSLDTLRDVASDDGSQYSMKLGSYFTISTNSVNTTHFSGYLYVSTAQQAADPNFSVYVIASEVNITKTYSGFSTTVILNTNFGVTPFWYSPFKTSLVSNIVQDPSSKFYIYPSIPYNNYTSHSRWRTIFYNPMVFENIAPNGSVYETEQLFENVEPLQLSYDAWYFSSSGNISMTISKLWVNYVQTNTTSLTTTGLLAISAESFFANANINFLYNPNNTRTTGMFLKCQPDYPVEFTLSGVNAVLEAYFNKTETTMGTLEWSDNDGTSLLVNSSFIIPGSFSVQYFIIDTGVRIVTSTSIPPTSTPVSSTQSTSSSQSTTVISTSASTQQSVSNVTNPVTSSVKSTTTSSSTKIITTSTIQTTTSESKLLYSSIWFSLALTLIL